MRDRCTLMVLNRPYLLSVYQTALVIREEWIYFQRNEISQLKQAFNP